MFALRDPASNCLVCVPETSLSPYEAFQTAFGLDIPRSCWQHLKFKIASNVIGIHERLPQITGFHVIEPCIPIVGGKGGFGSMLRAIGAQIEKTTNREACRDLSGRRIRDINEEKRVKDWLGKQADRERERKERKKAKLEKLCQETKHEFHDPEYDKQRSEIPDKIYESMEKAVELPSTSGTKGKRPSDEEETRLSKKKYLWTGVDDIDSDSDDSDSIASGQETDLKLDQANPESESKPETTHLGQAETLAEDSGVSQTSLSQEETRDVSAVSQNEDNEVMVECVKVELDTVKNEEGDHAKFQPKPTPQTTVELEQSVNNPPAEVKREMEEIQLEEYSSAQALESLGLDLLKAELQRRGMKCGGSLSERAARLFSVKGKSLNEISPSLLAGPAGKRRKIEICEFLQRSNFWGMLHYFVSK